MAPTPVDRARRELAAAEVRLAQAKQDVADADARLDAALAELGWRRVT